MSGAQEDVFLFTSFMYELIIAKICHEVKMTLSRWLGQPLRAEMTSDDVATIHSCPMRDVRRRRNRAFIRALQILIDETSSLDLKQNRFIDKKTFGGRSSEEGCASERGCDREDKERATSSGSAALHRQSDCA
jgi:hypothetical protein